MEEREDFAGKDFGSRSLRMVVFLFGVFGL